MIDVFSAQTTHSVIYILCLEMIRRTSIIAERYGPIQLQLYRRFFNIIDRVSEVATWAI